MLKTARATGTTLTNIGETAIIRDGRNHIIKCRFGAKYAGLKYTYWDSKESKYKEREIQVNTSETYLYNDTGRDAKLALTWKDPPDNGDVRVTRLSSVSNIQSKEEEDTMYSEGGTNQLDMLALSQEDMRNLEKSKERDGGVIAVRIWFEVQGFGSFSSDGVFDTANGTTNLWIKPGYVLTIKAKPASGWGFSHWLLNGQFAGSELQRTITARAGLKIAAVFNRAAATSERGIVDGWELEGPGKEDSSTVPTGCSTVEYSNPGDSQFSVYFYLNDNQLGSLGPGTSHQRACSPGDRVKVKSGDDAQQGQRARGTFYFQ